MQRLADEARAVREQLAALDKELEQSPREQFKRKIREDQQRKRSLSNESDQQVLQITL